MIYISIILGILLGESMKKTRPIQKQRLTFDSFTLNVPQFHIILNNLGLVVPCSLRPSFRCASKRNPV